MNTKKIFAMLSAGAVLAAAAPVFADPPHWARAHGYRDRGYDNDVVVVERYQRPVVREYVVERPVYVERRVVYVERPPVVVGPPAYYPAPPAYNQPPVYGAPSPSSVSVLGTLAGATIGAVAGHQVGHGNGQTAATVVGGVLGGVLGSRGW